MSLREGAVEAMAEAWKEARQSPIVNIGAANAALDALCDYLAENPDEWAEETRVPTLVGGDALALIAILRESDDE